MADKQLSQVKPEVVSGKVQQGYALSMLELAVATGYSYGTVREWKSRGLPLLDGKITFEDFQTWKRKQIGLESSPQKPARRQAPNVGKCG
jgi:hypothetical protein